MPTAERTDVRPSFLARLPLTLTALEFALERHAGQVRDGDKAPFVLHPLEVASLLSLAGYPDHVAAAGVLHDLLEDTDTSESELERRFGSEVASLVSAVSEDPAIEGERARKAALREQVASAPAEAAAVFAADKVSKARELRLTLSCGLLAGGAADQKLDHYEASLSVLDAALALTIRSSNSCASSSRRWPCFPLASGIARRSGRLHGPSLLHRRCGSAQTVHGALPRLVERRCGVPCPGAWVAVAP